MTYEDYFGLSEQPFSNSPNGRYFCSTTQHQQALIKMMYAAYSMKGLAVVTGEIGTGKTTLARHLLEELPQDEYETNLLVIVHSNISTIWLLKKIAALLGVEEPKEDKLNVLRQIFDKLLEIHDSGRKAIIIVDEAQMLNTQELMEEFRGLLNMELPGEKLITFILFGLPELEDNLRLDKPLEQRVAVRYTLKSLDLEPTREYIKYRLDVAGADEKIFTETAIKAIHKYSRGYPRLVNTICDNALFEAYLQQAKPVGLDIIKKVAMDLRLISTTYQEQIKSIRQEIGKLKKQSRP
jgi:type II secretory pathway predicted ATPase ExeA